MKNYYFKTIVLLFFVVTFMACKKNLLTSETENNKLPEIKTNAVQMGEDNVIIGLNQNWSNLPQLNDPILIKNINKLSPEMIRFPGGTVTHKWNWRTGGTGNSWDEEHQIGDVKKLVDSTGAKIMFVLDIVHSTVQDQIEMLDSVHSLGVPIEYIELGNELYSNNASHNYVVPFPTGASYADSVSKWVPFLKNAYPNAKIAALLIAKTTNDTRSNTWNLKVKNFIDSASVAIDAYTYHLYIRKGDDAADRIADFDTAKISTPGKEIWITEYGNQNDLNSTYFTELEILADYVEANFDIALSHAIIGNNEQFSKLNPSSGGHDFTTEGEIFLTRADLRNSPIPVVINEIYNSQGTNGLNDAVELLVIRNNLNMKKMILKNFTSDGNIDGGAAYRFNANPFWNSIPKGTIIVIRNSSGTSSVDVDPSDHKLDLNINDTNYFNRGSENPTANFDVAHGIDMWMIKYPNGSGSTTNGVTDAIHTVFAGSTTSALYATVTGAKLHCAQSFYSSANNARTVYCKNTTSHIYDYKDESTSQANRSLSGTLGTGNTTENTAYISQLRNGW